MEKNSQCAEWQKKARQFVSEYILSSENKSEPNRKKSFSLFKKIAENRFLGTLVSSEYGGFNLDYKSYGLIAEEFGYGSSSLCSLLTVHDMVCQAIEQFGDKKQKDAWLSRLVHGESIAAFALTEPRLGSSIDKIKTHIAMDGFELRIYGRKTWISYGQVADVILVFAKWDAEPVAILIPSNAKNLHIKPIKNALGMSNAMLADIQLDGVPVKESQILGAKGAGIKFIANHCLILGRFSVACSSTGIIRACLEASAKRVYEPNMDNNILIDKQLVAGIMTDMMSDYKVASLLCENAGQKMQSNLYNAIEDVMIAKYLCAKKAFKTASNTLQIFGAEACRQDSPIRTWLHDAKVCEIIEGSNEVMQATIAKLFLQNKLNSRNEQLL